MLSRACAVALVAAACGGSAGRAPNYITLDEPLVALVPAVAAQAWYRSPSSCGQGPWEIEVPLENARWGESVEVRLATPRAIAVHATIVADDAEVAQAAGTYDARGKVGGGADNARCVASATERLAAGRGGGNGGGGTTVTVTTPGTPGTVGPPPRPTVTSQLEIVDEEPVSIHVVRFGWMEKERRAGRVRVRLWSVEPNDLDGVRFGIARLVLRPNVPEAEYEVRLARQEEERRRKFEELSRRRAEEEARRAKTRTVVVTVKTVSAEEELARFRREEADRRRALEEEMLRAERAERRRRFCETHPEDRDCWGPGGRRWHLDLAAREADRRRYCEVNDEDARCWGADRLAQMSRASRARITAALAPPPQPDGPPPAALEETIPPKLSANAEWRPGYWQWTGKDWTWLAGMWRVPDSDIETEQTTSAPTPPPPPRPEPIPPPPMATTVWVAGFWQWSGTAWVWVAGSYQARPGGMQWRPTTWRARGGVHVLVPGGWVRAGGR
ncbi:MAG: hypothetical protein KF773_19000 [Deltaproteobacteria bacterium]|nr:hypothetical protein [Deltaproteobacteria bacterium]